MSGQDDTNTAGTASYKDNRFVLAGRNPTKEPLSTHKNIPATPPIHASKEPTINESGQEWRWTGGPQNRTAKDRPNRFRINLRPAADHQRDPEQNAGEVGNREKRSCMAHLELTLRLISWLVALAAFSSAIYVSVHVKSQRTSAAFGQLAGLFALVLDSLKILGLTVDNKLTMVSSGKRASADLLITTLSIAIVALWWKLGAQDGVFEPFGKVSELTVAIALMMTNGAFRLLYFVAALVWTW